MAAAAAARGAAEAAAAAFVVGKNEPGVGRLYRCRTPVPLCVSVRGNGRLLYPLYHFVVDFVC